MPIPVLLSTIEMQVIPDESPDTSYLEQEGFEDRLTEYRARSFGFVGVRASVEISIPHGRCSIVQRITSPGLWGIEDDSGTEYLESVFNEEVEILKSMLEELNCRVDNVED